MDKMRIQEQIERYLDGQCSEEERLRFESALKADSSMQEALTLEKAARLLVQEGGRVAVHQSMEDLESEWNGSKRKTTIIPFFSRRLVAVAAVVAGLVLTIIVLQNDTYQSPQDLFAEYYSPYRNPTVQRDATNNGTSSSWEKASLHYAHEEYAQAAEAFKLSLSDSTTIPYLAHFYLGVSLLQSDVAQSAEAILSFQKVLAMDTDFREAAMWYKALALLKMENVDEAKILLFELVESDSYQKENAEKVLDELN